MKILKSFVRLSEILGKTSFTNQEEILWLKSRISFSGELLNSSTKILSTSLLKGFLSEEMDSTINFINAPVIAEESGIVLGRNHFD